MDDPNVNWAMLIYEELRKHREREELPSLINFGSCGLHIVHGALKTGVTTTEWNLKRILKSIYTLLHDTPARRADYISITECDEFPFAFCATRWVEDMKVANRAVELWPNIKKVVEKWEKLAPSKRPKGKNYQTVLAAIKDNLTVAKLNYFSFIASILEPFLTKYQSDDPLVPFMYDDITSLV